MNSSSSFSICAIESNPITAVYEESKRSRERASSGDSLEEGLWRGELGWFGNILNKIK